MMISACKPQQHPRAEARVTASRQSRARGTPKGATVSACKPQQHPRAEARATASRQSRMTSATALPLDRNPAGIYEASWPENRTTFLPQLYPAKTSLLRVKRGSKPIKARARAPNPVLDCRRQSSSRAEAPELLQCRCRIGSHQNACHFLSHTSPLHSIRENRAQS